MTARDTDKIAVVGAGLMGHGIAQGFAVAGHEVRLHDLGQEQLDRAVDNIGRNLRMLVESNAIGGGEAEAALGRVSVSTQLEETVADADFVLEVVTEDLDTKRNVFSQMDRLCPEHAILASSSSTFMPSRLASATRRADRVLVTHYFNPPYLVPLVEVVRSPETSEQTFQTAWDLLERSGKRPVHVKKEVPGFIGNRLQIALLRECLALVESGVATAQDVDTVVTNSIGRRWAASGPIEVFDGGGWDVILSVISQLSGEIDSSREPSALVERMVERGELGVKSGKGFYDWTPESAEELRRRIAHALLEIDGWPAAGDRSVTGSEG